MNKILTLMTGIGLGSLLVYLSKKKSAPEFACDEVEEVIGASSSDLCKQANQKKVVDDSPSLQLVQSQSSDLARAYVAFFSVGVALGACYLLKPEAIGYVGLMAVLTLYTSLSGNHLPPSEVLFRIMALVAGPSLLSLPYILFLRWAAGGWAIRTRC